MTARRALAMFLLLAGSAQAQALQQQLNQTLQTLAQTKDTQATLAEKQEKTRTELESLQDHSTALAERLQVSERRVSEEEGALSEANHRLAEKQKAFDARKAEYAATVVTLLRIRQLPMTAMFAQSDNVERLMRTASVLEKTNEAVAQKAHALREDLVELKKLTADAAARRKATAKETAVLSAEQEQLESAVRARQKLEAQLSVDRAHAEEKVASLSKQSESLQSLIGKLDAQARAEAAKAKQAPKPKPGRGLSGARGNLHLPVAGDVIHRFGERKSDNENYRGLVIRARSGAAVVAPYDGEVVFNGPFRDYGNMLLIKHGNGYISLISGLGKVTASLNQNVIRGEPVGAMPDEKNPQAYVELRDSDAKPIDPGDWFAKVGK